MMQELQGGNSNQVLRDNNTVLRKMGKWSPFVHQFLNHLHANGLNGVPRFIEIVDDRERLTYLQGEIGHYPLQDYMRTDQVVVDAAQFLRKLHDLSRSFEIPPDAAFMLPDVSVTDYEVIGHNDFAPYNCVFHTGKFVGVIDFDTASPTTRLWDIAYAVYRFSPLATDQHCRAMGFQRLPNRKYRLDLFCDAYGLTERASLIPTVIARLEVLINYMQSTGSNLDHIATYQQDIEFIQQNLEILA